MANPPSFERYISYLKIKRGPDQCLEDRALIIHQENQKEIKEIKRSLNILIHPGRGGTRKGAGRPKTDRWERLAEDETLQILLGQNGITLSLGFARGKRFLKRMINNSANLNSLITALEAMDRDGKFLRYTSNDHLYLDEDGLAYVETRAAGHALYGLKERSAIGQHSYRTEYLKRKDDRGYGLELKRMAAHQTRLWDEKRERGGADRL